MFYKRWSNSVALPIGPQWGDPDNGKGGVAACMIWSRKTNGKQRPASAAAAVHRPPVAKNKPSFKVTGKGLSVREPGGLNEQEVVDAVHEARRSVAKRPATALADFGRASRPINPTPPPTVRNNSRHVNYIKRNIDDLKRGTDVRRSVSNVKRNDVISPEEVTGWTYKYKEKNIYDLYDVDGFHSPSTPSRTGSVAGYVPSPTIGHGLPERHSRISEFHPKHHANQTEFTVKTNGHHTNLQNNVAIQPRNNLQHTAANEKVQPKGKMQDEKYEHLSKELDRAIQTIKDLTRFQKETLGMYRTSNPAFSTTYDRDFNSKPSNAVVTNGYLGYRPPQPPPAEARQKRDFVKENARPMIKPREAWRPLQNGYIDKPKLHTVSGPDGLMTIRVDCGDKPVKNITVRVLNDKNGPKVTLDP